MSLLCKPVGRGNWAPVRITVEASRNAPRPLDFYVGQRLQMGGQTLRVCAVLG